MRLARFVWLYVACNLSLSNVARAEPGVLLAQAGSPQTAIVLGTEPTWIEQHAAQELARYLEQISGASLPIRSVVSGQWPVASDQSAIILIGRPETNPLVRQLVDSGVVRLSPDEPGLDGFIIQTADLRPQTPDHAPRPTLHAPRALILGGSMDRGTLYAVYHLLENYFGVGFFQDEERIPRRPTLRLPDLRVAERPRFADRICNFEWRTGGYPRMGSRYWTWEQWKHALEWMSKRKLNMHWGIFWGLPPYRQEIMNQAARYGRQLGISFVDSAHVDAATLTRMEPDVGNDHIYHISATESREQAKGLRVKQIYDQIRAADPQFLRAYHDVWDLHCMNFSREEGQEYFSDVPQDVVVMEMVDQRPNDPLYKRYDYYWGREWVYAWLHSLYPSDVMGGSLRAVIDQLHEIARDPKAERCRGMLIWSEGTRYWSNPMWAYVLTTLAWNPLSVDKNDIFRHYAELRYGPQSAGRMSQAIGLALDWMDRHGPGRALHRLGTWEYGGDLSKNYETEIHNYDDLMVLRQALEIALEERSRLEGQQGYEADLTEVARAYLSELFARELLKTHRAYRQATMAVAGGKENVELQPGATLLLAEDFERPESLQGWQAALGSWEVKDGELAQTEESYRLFKLILLPKPDWQDYHLRVKVKFIGGGNATGIVFRARDKDNYCFLWLRPADGITTLYWVKNGVGRNMGGDARVSLPVDEWHQVDILVVGGHLKAYIDGIQMFERQEPDLAGDYRAGGIGFVTNETFARFDEIRVWTAREQETAPPAAMLDPEGYQRNLEIFEQEKDRLLPILDALDAILSTRPLYYLGPTVEELRRNHDEPALQEFLGAWFGPGWEPVYWRVEAYEMLHKVYRPEVAAYLEMLDARLRRKEAQLNPLGNPEYAAALATIEREFKADPIVKERFSGTTTEAIARALRLVGED